MASQHISGGRGLPLPGLCASPLSNLAMFKLPFLCFLLRVWYRDTGHFIGFFSQPRLWHLPSAKSVPSTPVRPYDISEVCRIIPNSLMCPYQSSTLTQLRQLNQRLNLKLQDWIPPVINPWGISYLRIYSRPRGTLTETPPSPPPGLLTSNE